MDCYYTVCWAALLVVFKETSVIADTYHAVVVEYAPTHDPNVDKYTNIMNNLWNFVNITRTANNKFAVDIILFPEFSLTRYNNQIHYMEVPNPSVKINPCVSKGILDAVLVELSCTARETQTYVVVNVDEKYYNATLKDTLYFNTVVVFDSNGTIIVRYRKIHLFNEEDKTPSPDKQIVYFDTAFGVRFGVLTCYDIFFEDPGVMLIDKFNITHFVFPTAWGSQLPFFAATQTQYYWSYTHDVVLLASGYNNPMEGSTGSGIYLGRCGPAAYKLTETKGTFMLHAEVPKKLRPEGVPIAGRNICKYGSTTSFPEKVDIVKEQDKHIKGTTEDQLTFFGANFFNDYTTKSIVLPAPSMEGLLNISNFTVPFIVEETICINSLCCMFSLNITAKFNKTKKDWTRRDDYSKFFYRLAAFDGVHKYVPNGAVGEQNCAIVSCINTDVTSCGQTTDNSTAEPNQITSFFQTEFIFNSITIVGSFSKNRSVVGPNVLLTGDGDNFGSLLSPEKFNFSVQPPKNKSVLITFQTAEAIKKLVTVSLYGRLFSRDYTT